MSTRTARPLFDGPIVKRAIWDAFYKLNPRHQLRNPVMFTVLIGSIFTTILAFRAAAVPGTESAAFVAGIAAWLWFTLLFANFAEAMAEGRGKAQADALRKSRQEVMACRLTNNNVREMVRSFEDAGVAAIFVHGRTRAQGFAGTVNLAGIRAVVQAVKSIPVIGNGDVTTPAAARHMLAETGCAGVSIGRGAFYDPWIFRHTHAYLRTGAPPPEATYRERVAVMCRHLDLAVEIFGEELGCRLFRKPATWYARRLGPAKEFKRSVVNLRTRAEFAEILARYEKWRAPYCDEEGELLPRFQPAPLAASFLPGHEESGGRDAIPVPKGPVEVW